jgi:DHA1 family bicyclomycin/chloramphenicol resistance-like MFS transporter
VRALPLRLFILLTACAALGPLQLSVYLPTLPLVQRDFGVDIAAVQWTVSLALAAFGAGLLLFGPMSDRFGRRPLLLAGLALFDLASVSAALAPSLGLLVLARALQGAGAAMLFIGARAIVADLTPKEHLQRSVAQLTMVVLTAQMIAPLIGNIAMAWIGWRAIQRGLAVAGLLITLVAWRGIPETLRRDGAAKAEDSTSWLALLVPVATLLARPRYGVQLVQIGLLYSAYPAFVAIAPHLMIQVFHRPPTDYAYYFALLPLGYFSGNALVLRFGQRVGTANLIRCGALWAMASAGLAMALLAFGPRHPLALFVPAGLLLNLGLGLALPSATARAITHSWPNMASGWGLAGFTQQVVAACAVQVLGFFPVYSPFPVLALCASMVLVAALLESLLGGLSAGSRARPASHRAR